MIEVQAKSYTKVIDKGPQKYRTFARSNEQLGQD